MRQVVLGTAMMTMACASMPPDGEPVGTGSPAYRCDAAGLEDLIGRPATAELGAEALRRSGARTLRWIRPDDAVTMDFREDRLNIHLDPQHQVERLACG